MHVPFDFAARRRILPRLSPGLRPRSPRRNRTTHVPAESFCSWRTVAGMIPCQPTPEHQP